MEEKLDIISFQVLWNRLISVVDEVDAAVMRTAFSSIIRDVHDYSCALFDRRGMLVAQASYTSPGHIGGMVIAAKKIVTEYFPHEEGLEEGDVLVTNDPWLLAGHLPDIAVFTPIFYHGKVVAFAGTIFHHIDIGGALDSMRREVYEEGLQIPVLKIYKKNVPNEDLFKILHANVRVSDQVVGDILSQIAANGVCGMRISTLLDEQGWENLDELVDKICDHSERGMRSAIEAIPDGLYTYEGELDRPGVGKENVKVKLAIEVKGSNIRADFAGSGAQVDEGINCVMNYTYSYFFWAIKSLAAPYIPNNDGCVRPIEVVAPEGCIYNCRYPAAVVGRTSTGMYIPDYVYEALADVIPDKVIAGSGSTPVWWTTFSGYKYSGKQFVVAPLLSGGMGARSTKDGILCFFPANAKAGPVEVLENDAPLLVRRKQFICDSGGAGKFRGGLGQEFAVQIPEGDIGPKPGTEVVEVVKGGRYLCGATGLMGGKRGQKAKVSINDAQANWGYGHILKAGDTVVFAPPGGGGFYDPLEREINLVEYDVLNGYVSLERAKEDYGVVIDPKTLKANLEATKKLREDRLAGKSAQ